MDVARLEPMYGIEEDDEIADDHPDQPGRLGERQEPQGEEGIVERR